MDGLPEGSTPLVWFHTHPNINSPITLGNFTYDTYPYEFSPRDKATLDLLGQKYPMISSAILMGDSQLLFWWYCATPATCGWSQPVPANAAPPVQTFP
jgi:hypothetical protein